MPPRHYRYQLRNVRRNIFVTQTNIIDTPLDYESNVIFSNSKGFQFTAFQEQLFNIVDVITQRLEINEIITQVNKLINSLSSAVELRNLFENIESTAISIIQNFADGIDIGIISTRVNYLRNVISNIPDGAAQEDYAVIGQLILDVLGMLTGGVDLASLQNQITDIQTTIQPDVTYYDNIEEIKTLICSIVQNIADGVDIGIITNRINYLRDLITNIPT
jgi:hypothetical protein